MSSNGHIKASGLRARLSHPIIDADGHWLEFGPTVREQLRKIGGDGAVEGFTRFGSQVAKELASQYSIGYYSNNTKNDGKFRKIQVKVNKPGLVVRTKKGYYPKKFKK